MNPSFEAFVDPPDGFHEKPGTRSNRDGQFSPPEARMVVEPRMQLLGLCSIDARRKCRFLVFGADKRRFFGAPEKRKIRRKIFWRGRKSHLAAEHHKAAPKKKKAEVFPLQPYPRRLLEGFAKAPRAPPFRNNSSHNDKPPSFMG